MIAPLSHRHRHGQLHQDFAQSGARSLGLLLARLERGQLGHALAHEIELDEHRDLGAQDVGVERLGQVVDGASLIRARHELLVGLHRGQEDDRHAARLAAVADHLRRLEPVHARHGDVEQNDGELLLERRLQGVVARLRRYDALAERL